MRALLLPAFLLALPSLGAAQLAETSSKRDSVAYQRQDLFAAQLERSVIYAGKALGNLNGLIFEARLQPHFVFGASGKNVVVFTPEVNLRMLAEESKPVRSPSYVPRLSWYHVVKDPGPSSGGDATYFFGSIAHYSNGQEGTLRPTPDSLNARDGNFSTNFLEAGVSHTEWRDYKGIRVPSGFRLSAEWHIPGMMDDTTRAIYSPFRVHWLLNAPIDRLGYNAVRFTYLGGHQLGVDKFAQRLAVSYTQGIPFSALMPAEFFRSSNFGFMLNVYHGMDYYNSRLNRNITTWRFGIITLRSPEQGGWAVR